MVDDDDDDIILVSFRLEKVNRMRRCFVSMRVFPTAISLCVFLLPVLTLCGHCDRCVGASPAKTGRCPECKL
ncbi:hypothetical protein CEXT_295491 [Caerostris extrusa]|uniref:Uncharacterized protein n=1 Tax=Caerostris extrusa TaxID=172846 RepID=A0AAV4WV54_CAEEX|nr:hypothetical protein CEXT_295491 [Caerostris extrusa]